MRKILSQLQKATVDYNMINSGDCIAIGVSGGKDSLTLLSSLSAFQKYEISNFQIKALTLDTGFKGCDFSPISRYCERNNIEYIIQKSDIAEIIFDIRKETNPCALCAKMRRGALNNLAKEHGCNKIALGHHFDDAVETYFLSLFYEGRINCFQPTTHLDRIDITQIRPLLYVKESIISAYAKSEELPVVHNPCPANKHTKREFIKQHLAELETQVPGVKDRIFGAIKRGIFDRS